MYQEEVLKHFQNPKNAGKIENADGVGAIGDPSCGDFLRIYIKVKDNYIADIKFEIYGCPAAIATSSVLTELAKGKTLDEAWEITEEDILEAIGGLPENKEHCSNLGAEALYKAIISYIVNSTSQS